MPVPSQAGIAELFQVKPRNISIPLKNIYAEGELTCKDFLQVQTESARQVERSRKLYNLDALIQLSGRELLTHAGRISQQMTQEKVEMEFNAFKITQRCRQREESLKELEEDLKQLKPSSKKEDE